MQGQASTANVVHRELVLGGQRSGKSRRAEQLARAWLGDDAHGATFIATARAGDADMAERIASHRRDRAEQLPRMGCVEAPVDLPGAIRASAAWRDPGHLLVIDCLTLWLVNLGPADGGDAAGIHVAWAAAAEAATGQLIEALQACAGPVVLVSNEIGLGVVPLGAQTRVYVDALGRLNQQVAQHCERVCLMVAGLPLCVKGSLR